MNTAATWEHFEHKADVGVRGYGAGVEEAFANGAVAMIAAMTDPAAIALKREVCIRCEAADLELLFVDWLNALVSLMDVERAVFGRFEVRIEGSPHPNTFPDPPLSLRDAGEVCEGEGGDAPHPDPLPRGEGGWGTHAVCDASTRGRPRGTGGPGVPVPGARLRLHGRAWGDRVRADMAPACEVKAATYHALKVERRPDGVWVAQCVVDV